MRTEIKTSREITPTKNTAELAHNLGISALKSFAKRQKTAAARLNKAEKQDPNVKLEELKKVFRRLGVHPNSKSTKKVSTFQTTSNEKLDVTFDGKSGKYLIVHNNDWANPDLFDNADDVAKKIQTLINEGFKAPSLGPSVLVTPK